MMKKLYTEPAIDIKSFYNENIVTSSGVSYDGEKVNSTDDDTTHRFFDISWNDIVL